jgi:hypothetical protein
MPASWNWSTIDQLLHWLPLPEVQSAEKLYGQP